MLYGELVNMLMVPEGATSGRPLKEILEHRVKWLGDGDLTPSSSPPLFPNQVLFRNTGIYFHHTG